MIEGASAFGLIAAALWGGSDFTGGMGAKGAGGTIPGSLRVIMLAHVSSMVVLLLAAMLWEGRYPGLRIAGWSALSGFIVAVSLALFYKLLSHGKMGISAAVSGVLAAAIPAAVAFFREGSPGRLRLGGFALAAVAIWLVGADTTGDGSTLEASQPLLPKAGLTGRSREERTTVLLAILCGAGFGVYFLTLKRAGSGGVLWPIVSVRLASSTTCALLLLAGGSRLIPTAGGEGGSLPWAWIGWTALLGIGGDLAFVTATRAGRLDVAAVLASLYPASTILLAAWLLKERPTGRQRIGMATALAAAVMITL